MAEMEGAVISRSPPRRRLEVAREETPQLIAAGKVAGTPVYDRTGERLGTIEDLMLDKHSGRVAYAVMRFGGFLGHILGERVHPLPWSVLRYDVPARRLCGRPGSRHAAGAPAYGPGDAPDWTSRDWGRSVDDYWGARRSGARRQQLRQVGRGRYSLPKPHPSFLWVERRCAARSHFQK